MKKLLKKINKKTGWLHYFYFQMVHVFGLFMLAAIIATVIFKTIFPQLGSYMILALLIMFASFITLSISLTKDKRFRKSLIQIAIIITMVYLITIYLI